MAEVKRRTRERLQIAAKRRSTATCSTRDKEMDGIALESVLQNFLTSRVPRRRSGRPSSTNASPTRGSPNIGSLSEITSQANVQSANQKRGGLFRAKEMGKWNSAAELTDNLQKSQNKAQSNDEESKARGASPHEKEVKPSRKDDSHSSKRTPSISSSVRTFSITANDDEEDVQDNNEEEAQKLREASRKVLRFQNSRGSVSSGEYSLENQKSPGAGTGLSRQRTVEEDTDRYPGDPTNEDLVTFLTNPPPTSKRNLGRRYTLPTKVPKTEEEEDNVWDQPPIRIPNPVTREKGAASAEGAERNEVFDFTDVSHNLKKYGAEDQSSPSAEKKSKPNISSADVPNKGFVEQSQQGKSKDAGNQMQRNTENTPPRTAWIKTETTGLFFNLFKRLGDMSKVQNSKDTAHKGSDSSV